MSAQLASQLQALSDRGVSNPAEFASLDAQTVERTLAWFDQQGDRVGVGVLVRELRNGGRKAPARRDLLGREAQYGRDVCAWIRKHFPDLCNTDWGPHPAAIVAVIRLHHLHGKGSLRPGTHGSQIRAAVEDWEHRFEEAA